MKRPQFTVSFDGLAVESGQMDVRAHCSGTASDRRSAVSPGAGVEKDSRPLRQKQRFHAGVIVRAIGNAPISRL